MSKNESIRLKLFRIVPTLAVIGLALFAESLGLGRALDRRIHDAYLQLPATVAPRLPGMVADVVVVTIDPRSLRALAGWPWPRDLYAR